MKWIKPADVKNTADTWVSGIKFGRETYQFLVAKPHDQVSYALKLINIDAETKTSLHSSSIDMLAVANGKPFEYLPFWIYG